MSRWFRHYTGMMRDEKLVAVAIRSKQPVERVVWIWGVILESASEIDDGGRFEVDPIEVAYFLRTDEADVAAVFQALTNAGRLADGIVVKWSDRQYQSDKSAERQARYRERKQGKDRHGDNGSLGGDGVVTSRDGHVTPQEAETDTDQNQIENTPPSPQGGEAGASFADVEKCFPRSPHFNHAKAERAWRRLAPADKQACASKAERFGRWWAAEQVKRNRSMADSLPFAPPLDKWIADGAWRSFEALPAQSQPSPDLVVIQEGDPIIPAIERIRGRKVIFGDRGTSTVTKAEIEQARAA